MLAIHWYKTTKAEQVLIIRDTNASRWLVTANHLCATADGGFELRHVRPEGMKTDLTITERDAPINLVVGMDSLPGDTRKSICFGSVVAYRRFDARNAYLGHWRDPEDAVHYRLLGMDPNGKWWFANGEEFLAERLTGVPALIWSTESRQHLRLLTYGYHPRFVSCDGLIDCTTGLHVNAIDSPKLEGLE